MLCGAGMSKLNTSCLVFSSLLSISSLALAGPAPVVGGAPVPPGRWPDVVAIELRGGGLCTGTLVAPDVVLTAGHCIDGEPAAVAIDTVDYAAPGGERIPVAWSRAYPDWERRYDVGVVVLARPARQAPRLVASACTVRPRLVIGAPVDVVGFGLATPWATDANTRLRQATIPITDPTCTYDPACEPSVAPHGEFIAGGGGLDSCFGDSGGPVYLETPEGPALAGIVSRGLALSVAPCGGGGVYVRADKVTSWIQRVTGRTLTRTRCDAPADADTDTDTDTAADSADAADAADATTGCTAGGGELGAAVVLLTAGVWRRRRRA